MSRDLRPFLRLALIGALAASFALAACGRKGPLDPPPAASYTGQQPAPSAQQSATMNSNVTAKPLLGPDGRVLLPAGTPKKQIPLDVLLN